MPTGGGRHDGAGVDRGEVAHARRRHVFVLRRSSWRGSIPPAPAFRRAWSRAGSRDNGRLVHEPVPVVGHRGAVSQLGVVRACGRDPGCSTGRSGPGRRSPFPMRREVGGLGPRAGRHLGGGQRCRCGYRIGRDGVPLVVCPRARNTRAAGRRPPCNVVASRPCSNPMASEGQHRVVQVVQVDAVFHRPRR